MQKPAPAYSRAASTLTLLAVLFLSAAALRVCLPVACKAVKNVWRMTYDLDPLYWGRNDERFPSPRCCAGAECVAPRAAARRNAVVTYLRSDAYLPLLKQMECTFRKSNAGVELAVMTVSGELGKESQAWLASRNVTRIEVPPLTFHNRYNSRYSHNWLKLRAWGLSQYDAIVLIDADVAIVGPLEPLFALPVEFAGTADQSRLLGRWTRLKAALNGGVLLLRPCPAVEAHMLQLVQEHPRLQFADGAAEQDFLSWYFRYSSMVLPLEYNTMASDSLQANGLTVGGLRPAVVHFTQNKPFKGAVAGKPGHSMLCSPQELAA